MSYNTCVLSLRETIEKLKQDENYRTYKNVRVYACWQNGYLRITRVTGGVQMIEYVGKKPEKVREALEEARRSNIAKNIQKRIDDLENQLSMMEVEAQRERHYHRMVRKIVENPLDHNLDYL